VSSLYEKQESTFPAKELFFLRRTVSKFWSLAAMSVAEQIPFFQDMDIIFFKKNILIAVT
jgi:hypothetical protein